MLENELRRLNEKTLEALANIEAGPASLPALWSFGFIGFEIIYLWNVAYCLHAE
jgi:hypothetical protein